MDKLVNKDAARAIFKDGQTFFIGGFMGAGTPQSLVDILVEQGIKNLTVICNDTDFPGKGIGKLVRNKQIKKVIASHIGTNPETGQQMNAKEIEVDLVPQGTLVERIRAGGAGLGGILTPTGVGTVVENGKEKINVQGKNYLLELPLKADIALIKAWKADKLGNLVFRKSARNFNPIMAMAADLVIAEVENVVETGELDPDTIMIPGALIDMLILS